MPYLQASVSLARVWALRAALARTEYDLQARLDVVVEALLRDIRRQRQSTRKGA